MENGICDFLGIWALVIGIYAAAAADRPNPAKLDDPNLRLVHTRHYDIHTDMDESLVTDLSSRMDVMYDQYQKTFSDFKPPTDAPPLAVYLFATHEKYMAFTDYSGVNTGGYSSMAGIRISPRTSRARAAMRFGERCSMRRFINLPTPGSAGIYRRG